MINGNPNDFIDTVYSGQEIFYKFNGVKYMFQGYQEGGLCYMEIQQHEPWTPDLVWKTEAESMLKCLDTFLEAPIFNGKKFWEAEQSIEWLDE